MSLFYSSLSETNGTNIEKPSPEEVLIHRKYLLGLLKQLRSQKRVALPSQNEGLLASAAAENSTFVPTGSEQEEAAATPAEGPKTRPDIIHGGVDRIGQVADDVSLYYVHCVSLWLFRQITPGH